MRYFLEFAYHGAAYHGWQKQSSVISVEEVLEEKLSLILNEPIDLYGSGRTDTGVHAEQQFAHFDSDKKITSETHLRRFNAILPPDISVREVYMVQPKAHARFDALSRSYQYRISRRKNPFQSELSLILCRPLDFDIMNEGASMLLSENMDPALDFACFSRVKTNVNNFRCHISECKWIVTNENTLNETWTLHITANRFLRGMVRSIVGTLLDIGLHKHTLADLQNILASGNRRKASRSVEAHGLYLTAVRYPKEIFLKNS